MTGTEPKAPQGQRRVARGPTRARWYRLRLKRWLRRVESVSELAGQWEAERPLRDELKLTDSETYEALMLIAARRQKLLRQRTAKSD